MKYIKIIILNLFQDLSRVKLSIMIYLKVSSNKRQILKQVQNDS